MMRVPAVFNGLKCSAAVIGSRVAAGSTCQRRGVFTKPTDKLTLHAANTIIKNAILKAKDEGFKPLTVVVLDAGGTLIACQRQDGASFMRFDVAQAKAYGCLALGINMRALRDGGQNPNGPWGTWGQTFINSAVTISHGKIAPVPGGILIKSSEGDNIGAVGISGDTSDNDELCAMAGVEATGLASDPCYKVRVY